MLPRTDLPQATRTGAICDELRGRLPAAEELTVGEMGAQWAEAEARGACWRVGYFSLIGIMDAQNAAWEDYADARAED